MKKVIRRLKTFRILAIEMTISIIVQVYDMVTICGALCNFKEQIYNDLNFQPAVAFQIETSHLIYAANQMASFYTKCSTGMK